MDGSIDLDTNTIKVMLVTSSYTPDQDAHEFHDDITNEVSSAGYTAGGATLQNPAVTADNTDNEGVFDADNVTWSGVTFTTAGAVIYKDTGTSGTSPLIAYIDFGGNQAPSAQDFIIQWATEGILNIG